MSTAKSLKEFLSAPNNFTELNLSGQNIDDNVCIELAQVLKGNSTITGIHLSNNQIGDKGATALGQILNEHIYTINLAHNQIGDKGIVALAEGLKTNKFYFFSLSNNQIGDGGMIALANKLKSSKFVSYLDLSYNEIGDIGAGAFEDKFPLHVLNLNNNQVGDKGAIALAKGLKHLDIKYQAFVLGLDNNQIGNEGAISLVEALKDKEVFGSYKFNLQLKNNPIDIDATKYFETIQWKNVIIDYTKHQYSVLEMSQKESLLKVEEDSGLNLNDFNQTIQSERPLTELEKALARIKELEDQNNKKDIRIKELEEQSDQMSCIITDLQDNKKILIDEKFENQKVITDLLANSEFELIDKVVNINTIDPDYESSVNITGGIDN